VLNRLISPFGSRIRKLEGLAGGFVTGLALGIIWTPCTGPILAAVTTVAASGKIDTFVIALTIAYSVGVSVLLFF
jgi:cytochrome c biogenesis protein CcdA